MPISSPWNEWYVSLHLSSSVTIMCRCAVCGVISSSELDNLLWFVAGSRWIWGVRSILVQESGRWKEGCLLILKTAWVWSAVWSSVINMLSEFIWRTLHLTQTSESIAAQGLFRFWTRGWKHVKSVQMHHMMKVASLKVVTPTSCSVVRLYLPLCICSFRRSVGDVRTK